MNFLLILIAGFLVGRALSYVSHRIRCAHLRRAVDESAAEIYAAAEAARTKENDQ